MIRRISCFSIIIAMLIASSSWALVDSQDTKARIIEASSVLFNTPASMEILVDSLIQLLDVAVVLTSDTRYKDEIAYHVDVAKDIMKNKSVFNDKARQYLSLAYRMVTDGQKYLKPEELDEFVTPAEAQEKAMKHAKGLIAESLSELEAGHKKDAAKPLLELVLMVITPVSGN